MDDERRRCGTLPRGCPGQPSVHRPGTVVLGYTHPNLSKLALFLFRGTGHDDEWGADLTRENAICDLRLRQGPEGRLPKREPSPEGLGYLGRMTSAVGAALYRADAPT